MASTSGRPELMTLLHRYWLRFDLQDPRPSVLRVGCGVTAFSREDALSLVRQEVFGGAALPPVVEIVEDVDVSALDAGHILPNMEEPVSRGVWFPMGYRR